MGSDQRPLESSNASSLELDILLKIWGWMIRFQPLRLSSLGLGGSILRESSSIHATEQAHSWIRRPEDGRAVIEQVQVQEDTYSDLAAHFHWRVHEPGVPVGGTTNEVWQYKLSLRLIYDLRFHRPKMLGRFNYGSRPRQPLNEDCRIDSPF